jgi:dihydropteroate synthase
MGILNCTPDSFFDGGKYNSHEKALAHAVEMIEQGAVILDVGGESTRPGAQPVSVSEEIHRVIPVIRAIRSRYSHHRVLISIDTLKSEVARAALEAGADLVNDVSALHFDPHMKDLILERRCPVILNHMQGEPQTMQANPHYGDVVVDVLESLLETAQDLVQKGLDSQHIWIDPGIGFGKTLEHNQALLKHLSAFASAGFPVLLGASRKSFIAKTPGLETSDRLFPSVATALFGALQGVAVLRVHDVGATDEAFKLWKSLNL